MITRNVNMSTQLGPGSKTAGAVFFLLFFSKCFSVLCAGLILVPNGEDMGHSMGDYYPSRDLPLANRTALRAAGTPVSDAQYPHPWGVFFTILGTVLLDFDADACQSPARAYLLDVTVAGRECGCARQPGEPGAGQWSCQSQCFAF